MLKWIISQWVIRRLQQTNTIENKFYLHIHVPDLPSLIEVWLVFPSISCLFPWQKKDKRKTKWESTSPSFTQVRKNTVVRNSWVGSHTMYLLCMISVNWDPSSGVCDKLIKSSTWSKRKVNVTLSDNGLHCRLTFFVSIVGPWTITIHGRTKWTILQLCVELPGLWRKVRLKVTLFWFFFYLLFFHSKDRQLSKKKTVKWSIQF